MGVAVCSTIKDECGRIRVWYSALIKRHFQLEVVEYASTVSVFLYYETRAYHRGLEDRYALSVENL